MSIIPKKIHYCWFGGNPKNKLIYKCMQTWSQYFPDYEIIEWNENNYDVTKNVYCKEAYENKKWAFVSDYARLDIIYHHGGIYFDTDVEVLKNFESLIEEKGYFCFENSSTNTNEQLVASGLGFASPPHNKIVELMLREYDNIHFLIDGKMDLTPCPVRNTEALKKIGLKTDGTFQTFEDINIFPDDYFCGYDIVNGHEKITQNTYTVHHYNASWMNLSFLGILKYRIVRPLIRKILGNNRYDKYKSLMDNKKNCD